MSFGGLVREAVFRALDDAHMTMADIDAVVLGKAPDLFEGVMKPELYLADALGAVGKPMFRVHTAGLGRRHHRHRRRLPRAGRQAPHRPRGRVREAIGGQRAVRARQRPGASLGAGGAFAPFIRAYIHRSGAPEHIGWKVAVKDRLNALKNPYAHLHIADISIEKVKESPMMWDPIRFLESCPSSDGACAVVVTDEAGGNAAAADGRPPAWILGASSRSEPPSFPGRDPVRPARASSAPTTCTARPGSPTRAPRSTPPSSTCPSPGTRRSGSRPTSCATRATAGSSSTTAPPRSTVDCRSTRRAACSRATRSARPGLLRFAEAANQVRGAAGEHQVDGADVALAMAYGANSQYFSMWVVGSSLQPFD